MGKAGAANARAAGGPVMRAAGATNARRAGGRLARGPGAARRRVGRPITAPPCASD